MRCLLYLGDPVELCCDSSFHLLFFPGILEVTGSFLNWYGSWTCKTLFVSRSQRNLQSLALVGGVPKLEVRSRALWQKGTEFAIFFEIFLITAYPHWWIFAPGALVVCALFLFPSPFLYFPHLTKTLPWFSSASWKYSKHLFFLAFFPSQWKGANMKPGRNLLPVPVSSQEHLVDGEPFLRAPHLSVRWCIQPCLSSFSTALTSPAELCMLPQALCFGSSLWCLPPAFSTERKRCFLDCVFMWNI